MGKYTPGPWYWNPDYLCSGHGKESIVIMGHDPEYDGLMHTEEDANLIAAAPDLLEALDALVKSHAPDANFPAVNNARVAIAKAIGEL